MFMLQPGMGVRLSTYYRRREEDDGGFSALMAELRAARSEEQVCGLLGRGGHVLAHCASHLTHLAHAHTLHARSCSRRRAPSRRPRARPALPG